MKKMIIVLLVIVFINLCITLYIYKSKCVEADNIYNKVDTAINHVRIDSIQFIITQKESIIIKFKEHEKEINDKVNILDDSTNWELFKRLVSEE